MISQKRIQLTKLALALSIALSATPSFAQNTTSAIGGRISAADGKPAAGATVSIVHAESGSVSNVVTDAEGRYVARGLRTGGPYTIIVTKDGVTEKRENVFLQLAETAAVDATLGGVPMQTVTIAGTATRSETFSKTTMGAVTNITPTELAAHASLQRNLQDYARTDPRVSQTDKERGEMSVAGQNSRYNSLTIDGVAVNDTFGLEANGSPTAKQPISIEAIQSVQVNVANYDVTQKGYTGANVNAVTKSGTNKWKGSLYYVYRDDSMVGKRYNQTSDTYFDAPEFKEDTKGFTLGGPIIEDTLFIFAGVEQLKSSRSGPEFGPLGSTQTNVGITPSAIAAAQNIAQTKWGMDVGTLDLTGDKLDVRDSLVKLDWNINDSHRAMLRYSRTEQAEPIFAGNSQTSSSSSVSLNSQWYSDTRQVDTVVAQWFGDWTPTFSTEVKLSSRDFDKVPTLNSRLPAIGLQFFGPLPAGTPSSVRADTRFINFGTERSRQLNILRTKTFDGYAGANWSLGDHEVKFGVDYNKNEVYNGFLQNVFGNYTFGCLDSGPTVSYSFGAIKCSTATNAQLEAAVLENFQRGRPSSYQAQIPVAGGTLENAIAQFTLHDTGLFAQDTWSINSNLTVNAGLRLDHSKVDGRPLRNVAAAAPMVAGNAATNTRQSGGFGLDNTVTIDGSKLWQPRFGFNYRFDQERAAQVRGGVGLFQGAAATVWMSNPFSNPGVATRIVGCGGSFAACPRADGTFSADPNAPLVNFAGASPAANVDFLDPSFRQPSILKANLAFDTELPWYGLTFSAEYLYTRNKDAIYYQHLNLGAPTRIGKDGRELFYTASGYDAACWQGNGNAVSSCGVRTRALSNSAFADVITAKNTDKGQGNIVTMRVARPMSKGFGWSASYTFTEATEVSPLTSSTSGSNWSARSVFHPNEEAESPSSYAVKDRVNASMTWQQRFIGDYRTSFGVFYEGRSGKPYSWTYVNDLNGDNWGGNDLMYIPRAFGSGEVVFRGDTATSRTNEERFWSFVNQHGDLMAAAGGVVGRNSANSPWTNSIDMRITQELPGFWKGHRGVVAIDFMNVGNMLNKRWGRINEIGFQSGGGQARSFVDYGGMDAEGRYIYNVRNSVEDFNIRQVRGESQWAVQVSLKYEF